ncbi:hypothetical protein KKH13_04960 [Patescibacteria group bacterium]|nr:hypothetical protein [Patescibacteria group bacterium]
MVPGLEKEDEMPVMEVVRGENDLQDLVRSIRGFIQKENCPVVVLWGTRAAMEAEQRGTPGPRAAPTVGPILNDSVYRPSAPSQGFHLSFRGPGYGIEADVQDPLTLIDFIRQFTTAVIAGLNKDAKKEGEC